MTNSDFPLKLFTLLGVLLVVFVFLARVPAQGSEIVNTGDNFQFCEGENCLDIPFPTDFVFPTLVPSPTMEPEEGEGSESVGNINIPCLFGCPTNTPTPTMQPTNTPIPTDVPMGGGSGDGGSSGQGGGSSSSSSAGSTAGATTLAETGTFVSTLAYTILALGIAAIGLATFKYSQELKA